MMCSTLIWTSLAILWPAHPAWRDPFGTLQSIRAFTILNNRMSSANLATLCSSRTLNGISPSIDLWGDWAVLLISFRYRADIAIFVCERALSRSLTSFGRGVAHYLHENVPSSISSIFSQKGFRLQVLWNSTHPVFGGWSGVRWYLKLWRAFVSQTIRYWARSVVTNLGLSIWSHQLCPFAMQAESNGNCSPWTSRQSQIGD